VAAGIAVASCKPVAKDAAAKVGAELVLDVGGEGANVAFARVRDEGVQVIADDAVQRRVGRTAGNVRNSEAGHDPLAMRSVVPGPGVSTSERLRAFEGVHVKNRVAWDSRPSHFGAGLRGGPSPLR
jgi:hypothetical protein